MTEYILSESLKKEIADLKRTVKCDNTDYLTGYICALSVVEGIIAGQTTVSTQSVTHGCWIINSDGYYPQCSECLKEPQGRIMTDYCPNCGAKMDD